MEYSDIIIIGGGAAGLFAACAASRALHGRHVDKRVTLLEKNDRVGKKLLSTGNGRCNLSNTTIDARHYHSRTSDCVSQILKQCTPEEILKFFACIGLQTIEEDSRVYPFSQTASSVLDVLRMETEQRGVRIVTGACVTSIKRSKIFRVETRDQHGEVSRYSAKAVIITAGGKAAPATGSDGTGYTILADFGHTIEPLYPALTALNAQHPSLKTLKGIRVKPCRLTLTTGSRTLATDTGELLFTEYGLSGIPAMQVSGAAHGYNHLTAHIDLIPYETDQSLYATLRERRMLLGHLTTERFFTGWLHKQLGQALLREAGVDGTWLVASLDDDVLHTLTLLLKNWPFTVTGTRGYPFAQVTSGGAALNEFNTETLESLFIPGLFAAGEVLDAYGDCGGYNLHWAWLTGYLAGCGAADAVTQKG